MGQSGPTGLVPWHKIDHSFIHTHSITHSHTNQTQEQANNKHTHTIVLAHMHTRGHTPVVMLFIC